MVCWGSCKFMFIFVEKFKVILNLDLLDLVQIVDEKWWQRDQGEVGVEEEFFVLGVEVFNFQQELVFCDRVSFVVVEEVVLEWVFCFKLFCIQVKLKFKFNQNFFEVFGKGVEFYVCCQLWMEKYVIEFLSYILELVCCLLFIMFLFFFWKYFINVFGVF